MERRCVKVQLECLTFGADGLEEPLDVRSWESFERVKSQTSVLYENGSVNLLGCKVAFPFGNLLHGALVLGQVNVHLFQLE